MPKETPKNLSTIFTGHATYRYANELVINIQKVMTSWEKLKQNTELSPQLSQVIMLTQPAAIYQGRLSLHCLDSHSSIGNQLASQLRFIEQELLNHLNHGSNLTIKSINLDLISPIELNSATINPTKATRATVDTQALQQLANSADSTTLKTSIERLIQTLSNNK